MFNNKSNNPLEISLLLLSCLTLLTVGCGDKNKVMSYQMVEINNKNVEW